MVTTNGQRYAPLEEWQFRPDDEELGAALIRIVRSIESHDRRWDRREDERYAFPCMFELTPVHPDDLEILDDPITVVGKDISQSGLHFFHHASIPYQYMKMSVISPTTIDALDTPQLLVKLRWCRFLRPGWYDSGGQFLRVIE